jgi:plasmid stability protein
LADLAINEINDYVAVMASLTIRNLENATKESLRVRAAKHGRSMEEEARHILRSALAAASAEENLADAIRRRFAPLGGMELELPPREKGRDPPTFD